MNRPPKDASLKAKLEYVAYLEQTHGIVGALVKTTDNQVVTTEESVDAVTDFMERSIQELRNLQTIERS